MYETISGMTALQYDTNTYMIGTLKQKLNKMLKDKLQSEETPTTVLLNVH